MDYSILQQERSYHDLREPNHCSGMATIAKNVKLHLTDQKLEDLFIAVIRALDDWDQIECYKYTPHMQSEFSYSCDRKHLNCCH